MDNPVKIVQAYYDANVGKEWERLNKHPFEFTITTGMMEKYIKPGDRILDIGGGPGRYALHFAQKGCDVTLIDLSQENVNFALQKASERGVSIAALAGDARNAGAMVPPGSFDHVFVMGPMYHLLKESERMKAMDAALAALKTGGNAYVSFLLMFSGMIYLMKYAPEMILAEPEQKFIDVVLKDGTYAGCAFTEAYFTRVGDILPFMEKFPLEKRHLFGQEGFLSPCESNLLAQSKEVTDRWTQIALQLCEREELLAYAEHLMYIGQKSI